MCCFLISNSSLQGNNITFLKDINDSMNDFTIKVHLLRVSNLPSHKIKNGIFAKEILMVDEEGTRRQGSCFSNYLIKFGSYLNEGSTLLINNPTLITNRSNFKTVDCPHKIGFSYDTKIYYCNNFTGSAYALCFTPLSSILDGSYVKTQPIDVIGEVLCCSDMEKVTVKGGKETDKRTMLLEDLEGNKVQLTLWESYAHELTEYINKHPAESRIFIIVQLARVSLYKEKPTINNSFKLSRLFINNGCDEINSFKKSKMEREEGNGSLRTSSPLFYSFRDDFLVNYEFYKVTEIDRIEKEKTLIIVGTIKCVIEEVPWFYDACSKCNHKVVMEKPLNRIQLGEEKVWICENEHCHEKDIAAIQRFRIPLRVEDETGFIPLTLFERDAKRIFKKTAKEMWETYLQGGYKGMLPDDFEILVGKKYAFKIDVNKKYEFYGVSKLTDDSTVISELEKKPKYDKETISCTGDNEHTTYPLNKIVGKHPVQPEIPEGNTNCRLDLKRNLSDVYDVDDYDQSSTSKSRPYIDTTQVENGKSTLLIPKLEKK